IDDGARNALDLVDLICVDFGLEEHLQIREQFLAAPGVVGILLGIRHDLFEVEPAEKEGFDESHLGCGRTFEEVLGLLEFLLVPAFKSRHDVLLVYPTVLATSRTTSCSRGFVAFTSFTIVVVSAMGRLLSASFRSA